MRGSGDVYGAHSFRLVWDTNHLCGVIACGQARPKDAARQGCFAAPISFSDLGPLFHGYEFGSREVVVIDQ